MQQPSPNNLRYVPHKVLKEGVMYIATGESDHVLEIRTVILKVSRVYQPDGTTPAINLDGSPQYSWQTQIIGTALTRAEYDVRKKMEDF